MDYVDSILYVARIVFKLCSVHVRHISRRKIYAEVKLSFELIGSNWVN